MRPITKLSLLMERQLFFLQHTALILEHCFLLKRNEDTLFLKLDKQLTFYVCRMSNNYHFSNCVPIMYLTRNIDCQK
jgi:hypothetical protein